ncbi:MAG: LLM class F420-dependent oxidoreductase [SAR202 cluster bacterium]|jgi:probable F420-dependent oxidoreductase|nr:LLM class F420-dependent oxidoreductase [Dehalococcoidia bacterium]MQG53557.1 LLM class F420-dependent oxidoreductase [SAR202 cluster bacterium]|tara:strand:+ start:22729 stop:23676 length:948 start_codon:yes stop_codon:yes gene_type:complete
MEYGFYLPNSGAGVQPDALASIAKQGDRLSFYCMVMPDHILQPNKVNSTYPYSLTGDILEAGQSGDGEWPEQITTLAWLAGITERIRLVTSVMIIPYRNPILTAKMLSTLDMLSKGRLILGAGVGWMEEEFELLDTPPFAERGAVTNEYLEAFIELWTKDDPKFEGKYVNFSDITFLPKPVQKPYPPIWIGGQSKPAIRRAARLGNCWHPVGAIPAAPLEPEELAENLVFLHQYAERAGRDPSEIQVSVKAPLYDSGSSGGTRRRFSGSADEVRQDVQIYADVGVTHLIFDFRTADPHQTEDRMAQFAEEVMAVT